jgi:hypothetical protein
MRRDRQSVSITLCQRLRTRAKVRPSLFYFSKRFGVTLFGLGRIAGLKAELLFALSDELAQGFGNALAKPLDSSFGMFPRT